MWVSGSCVILGNCVTVPQNGFKCACLCAEAGEGSVYRMVSRDPGSPEDARVHLQEMGIEDSQGSSRIPWVDLISLTGTSSPSSGTQRHGA